MAETIFGRRLLGLKNYSVETCSTEQNILWNIFRPQIFPARKIFRPKRYRAKFYPAKRFSTDKVSGRKVVNRKTARPKKFSAKNFTAQNVFNRKKNRPKICSAEKQFGQKHIRLKKVQTKTFSAIFVRPKKKIDRFLFQLKFLETQIVMEYLIQERHLILKLK